MHVFTSRFYRELLPDLMGEREENVEWEKKHKFARLQSFATRQTRASLMKDTFLDNSDEHGSSWDTLVYGESDEERLEKVLGLTRLLHKQNQLIAKTAKIRSFVDGKLALMRHEKFTLDIEIKKAELQLAMLKWEHEVLVKYEERENLLAKEEKKLLERKEFVERKVRHLEPDIRSLQEKLKSMKDSEENIKVDFELQLKNVRDATSR